MDGVSISLRCFVLKQMSVDMSVRDPFVDQPHISINAHLYSAQMAACASARFS